MIGIYGGTFDPIHTGHLRSALDLYEDLGLSEVRLLPARRPPHRPSPQASLQQRLALLQAAVADQPGLVVDEQELSRQGPSYMIDTLSALRAEQADRPLGLILGLDAFLGLTCWHRWRELIGVAHLLVMRRPGVQLPVQGELACWLKEYRVDDVAALHQRPAGGLLFCQVTQMAISATDIRARQAAGRSIRYLVPDVVQEMIKQQGLYGPDDNR